MIWLLTTENLIPGKMKAFMKTVDYLRKDFAIVLIQLFIPPNKYKEAVKSKRFSNLNILEGIYCTISGWRNATNHITLSIYN